MTRMWMVRGASGRLFEEFREQNVVALGWSELAEAAKPGVSRERLAALYAELRPEFKPGTIRSGAAQVWRFVNDMTIGDYAITYNPSTRRYLVGTLTGVAKADMQSPVIGMALKRDAKWMYEVDRDRLSTDAKYALGSTLTLFQAAEFAAEELLALGEGRSPPARSDSPTTSVIVVAAAADADADAEDETRMLRDLEEQARELIKDRVDKLDWQEMQELVAGLLRALGYKTRISPIGPDRGADIVASPDGLGFENPRIVVEVKHRSGSMGSKEIRSFLGGRHKDDRGLYVSTGGFTKDARYEADRANIPLTLWELDDLVRTLVDQYEQLDSQSRQLIPLRRLYWPT